MSQFVSPKPALKTWMAGIGDFFFRWRNVAFPLILLALFLLVRPSNTLAGSPLLEPYRDAAAVLLVVMGLALRAAVIGLAYIKRGGRGGKVYAVDLVTSGLFGVCRNPLYVGNLVIVAGVLVMHGDPRVIVGGFALMAFIYQCIVYAEERFLEAKFGGAYLAYCEDVPRWSFRLSRLAGALEGMRFDLKKALYVDYGTIATSAAILAATELYEQLGHPGDPPFPLVVWSMWGVLGLSAAWMLLIRAHKKAPKRTAGGSGLT